MSSTLPRVKESAILRRWRVALLKEDGAMPLIRKASELRKRIEGLEDELHEVVEQIDEEANKLAGYYGGHDTPPSIIRASQGYWWEIPEICVSGTAHEALARYCVMAYEDGPVLRQR